MPSTRARPIATETPCPALSEERPPFRGSQQELAEAVGTGRKVVVRVLRELRQEGVVRTERDRMVIIDPGRLIEEQGWNPGS